MVPDISTCKSLFFLCQTKNVPVRLDQMYWLATSMARRFLLFERMTWDSTHLTPGRLMSHGSLSPKPWSNTDYITDLRRFWLNLTEEPLSLLQGLSGEHLDEETSLWSLMVPFLFTCPLLSVKCWISSHFLIMQFQWWWYLAHFDPMWNDTNIWGAAAMIPLTFTITLNVLNKICLLSQVTCEQAHQHDVRTLVKGETLSRLKHY